MSVIVPNLSGLDIAGKILTDIPGKRIIGADNRVRSTDLGQASFPQTSTYQDPQPQHGLTCISDHSGSFQRRCAVDVTDGITTHATLWKNDVTDVDRKDTLAERAETLDPALYIKPNRKENEIFSDSENTTKERNSSEHFRIPS